MMMVAVIMIVVFGSQFVSSTTYTGKFSQDKEIHEDQRLQSVDLPSISNQLTLPHASLEVMSSQMDANTIEALSSTIPDYEMQALKDLYNSTDGDNWWWRSYGAHWDFTNGNENPCTTDYYTTWQGLSCTQYSGIYHVTSIYLYSYNLHGTLPASLGNLSELTTLSMSCNSLTGTLPASLGNLSELTTLHVGFNSLTGTLPDSLGQLLKLNYLHMYSNSLTGTLPASLGNLSELTYLYMSSNSLTGTLPASLGNLTELITLYMSSNLLTGILPASLGILSGLHVLRLSDNLLTGTLPALLGQLSELYNLDMSSNSLTGALPASLGNLSELYYLNMSYNSLNGTLPASLGQLSKLAILDMYFNSLTGILPASLGTLPSSLYDIYLDNNRLTGAIPSSLCRCLQEMYISLTDNKFLCYPTCMTSSHYHVYVDENISVCDGPSYEDICILTSTIPDYEMQALKDLYDSTDGDNWWWRSYGAHWDFTNGNKLQCTAYYYNSWQGLTCTYNSSNDLFHVTSINLHWYYNLNGTLPDSLGQLSELTYLELDYSSYNTNRQLFGSIPASLGQLSKLIQLSLSYNSLTGTLPASLGQLNQLEYFYAGNNQLHGSIPDSFGDLNKLQVLSLYYNELSGDIPSSLCKCDEISHFSLYGNKFLCYPACLSSKYPYDYFIDNIPVCDNEEDNPVSKSSKSMMILWIVLPILFVLLVAASIFLYYRYRYRCLSSDSTDRTSQYVDINRNNNIMDEDNDHNHDVNCDLSISEDPETIVRYEDMSSLVGGNGASNEDRHQRRDHVSQVLEPVVIGELVSTVAGAVATDNEILNLPTASVANIDEEDVLYVDLFVDV